MRNEEVVKLLKEWKDEIVVVNNQLTAAVGILDASRGSFEKIKGHWWNRNLFWIGPCIVVIVTAAALSWSINATHSCSIEGNGIKIQRECSQKSTPPTK